MYWNNNNYHLIRSKLGQEIDVVKLVSMKKIEKLSADLKRLKQEKRAEKKLMEQKLIVKEIEIDRLNFLNTEDKKNWVTANQEIACLKKEVSNLKYANKELLSSNATVTKKLVLTQNSWFDLQQKDCTLEKIKTAARNGTSSNIQQLLQQNILTFQKLQQHNIFKCHNMYNEIENLRYELQSKNILCKTIDQKYFALSQTYARMKYIIVDNINYLIILLKDISNKKNNLFNNKNNIEYIIMDLINWKKNITIENAYHLNQYKLSYQHKHQVKLKRDYLNQIYKLAYLKEETRSQTVDRLENKDLRECTRNHSFKKLISTIKKADDIFKIILHSFKQRLAYCKTKGNITEFSYLKLINKLRSQNLQKIKDISNRFDSVNMSYHILEKEVYKLLDKSVDILYDEQENQKYINTENNKYNNVIDDIINFKVLNNQEFLLSVELQQSCKELDHVKELYIEIFLIKQKLVKHFKNYFKYFNHRDSYVQIKQEINILTDEIRTKFSVYLNIYIKWKKYIQFTHNFEKVLRNKKKYLMQIFTKLHYLRIRKGKTIVQSVCRKEEVSPLTLFK